MDKKRFIFLKEDFIQGFPAYCGFTVDYAKSGEFQSRLVIQTEHRQQDGFVHAGVIATMADHTAGYSAYTLVPKNMRILTIEFKINYLKPVKGDEIICKSKIISAGRKIFVSESEVYSISEKKEDLVSKAMVTLIAVNSSNQKETYNS